MISFRIRTHLFFYLSIVTLLLTVAIISLYTVRFKEHALRNLEEYGKTITLNTSFAITDHLINEDYAYLQDYVRQFSILPNVNSLEISDSEWNTLAATDIDKLGTAMPKDLPGKKLDADSHTNILVDTASKQLIVTTPITVEKVLMGRARVILSLQGIFSHMADVQKKGALTGLLFWLLALFLGSFASRLLTKPVHSFMKATESISQGDFNVSHPPTKLVMELEKFSRALTVMAHAIDTRETNLRTSEKKYRHLFERALEGIFVCDQNGTFLDVNPTMISMLGYSSREEILSRNIFDEIFAEQATAESFQSKLKRQSYIKGFELNLLKEDSSIVTVSLSCHTVTDAEGEVVKLEGMLRDTTKEKQDAAQIAQMRNYLNNIIESMPSMLIAVNNNSEITQWNTAAYQLTGIPSSQAMGKKIWDIAPCFNKYREHFDEISHNRQPIKLHREQLAEDADHLYNLTLFPLITNGSSGIAIRLDDITELEMKERQLRQAQKMESVGTLAGGLAHDFNNVLSGILGNLSIIQFQLDNKQLLPEDKLRQLVDRMASAGTRAADLVQQLLSLSKKQKADLVPVDLNLSIQNVSKIGQNTFDRSVKIITQQADSPAYIKADPTQIEQVILNLCINAVHAMTIMRDADPWGGILKLSLGKIIADNFFCKTHPEARQGLYWLLSISDTGIGMSTKTVSKIFDPFFTTKDKEKGTGLGLTMVYNIIQQLDGFIDVYSEERHGTTFNIFLPLLDYKSEKKVLDEKPEVHKGEGLILVIDDDAIMRETAQDILQSVGYRVIFADNGREGVETYRQQNQHISAVLLDMIMPVMSGKEAYIEIKAINPDAKILLVSGFRQDTRVEEVLQMGADGFLQKPYTLKNLTRTMKEIIND